MIALKLDWYSANIQLTDSAIQSQWLTVQYTEKKLNLWLFIAQNANGGMKMNPEDDDASSYSMPVAANADKMTNANHIELLYIDI